MRVLLRFTLLAATLVGCGTKTAAGPTWNKEVSPLVATRCANCHKEGGIAPFALTTYAQAKAHAQIMAAAVKSKEMPPWPAKAGDVHFLNDWSLTDAEIDTLTQWAAAGALEGDAAAKPDPAPLAMGLPMKRTDLTLTMPEKYTPKIVPDDYRCFPMKWPKDTPVNVTGFNARPGVAKQVHHIAVYGVPPDQADLPFQWDAEEDGPGYTCFGGPFGTHDANFPVNLLNAWIPGGQGMSYPRGLGIQIDPGTTVVLQVHYNTDSTHFDEDQTSLDYQLDPTVQTRAAYTPFLNVSWPLGLMPVPANQHTVQSYVADPRASFGALGSPLNTDHGFLIQGVMFHMHKLGTEGRVWITHADHSQTQILDIPSWNFHWQLEYMLDTPIRFQPGDQLGVSCSYDNKPSRWPDGVAKDTNWGEGTSDEMCVANLLSSE